MTRLFGAGWLGVVALLVAGIPGAAWAQASGDPMGPMTGGGPSADMNMESMGEMNAHMHFTALQPARPGDRERAAAILAEIRRVTARYTDVHAAEADGFTPNFPGFVRTHYHFSRRDNFMAALRQFDPARPTSLLYDRDAQGGYHLTGVMYTDRRDAPLAELDQRVPLSIGRWHQHLNICNPPVRSVAAYTGPHPRFGTNGSITTAADCAAAGGRFTPQLLGWMVHVYPFEGDPAKIWAIDRDMH